MKKKYILLFSLLIILVIELSLNTKPNSKKVIITPNNYKTENTSIKSDKYLIEPPYIKWVSTKTLKEDFTQAFTVTDGTINLECNNNTNYVGTGCKLNLTSSTEGSTSTVYNPIVLGDVTGNGESTITDMVKIATYAKKEIGLETEILKLAADTNLDNNISLNDSSILAFYSLQGVNLPLPSHEPENKNVIVIANKKITVGVNKTIKIEATTNQSDVSITSWTSQDESVVTVDSNGNVKGLKDGTTIVTITASNGDSLDIEVTVKSNISPTGISLNLTTVKLNVGDSKQLSATISPSNVTNKKVTWTSSDERLATVDATGKITAIKRGEVTITVATVDGNKQATCKVTVNQPVTGVSIFKNASPLDSTLNLVQGDCGVILQAKIDPYDASNQIVEWTSSNPNVVSVEPSGKLCAQAGGEATITVRTKDQGKTDTAKVKVKVPIEELFVAPKKATLTLKKDKTVTLQLTTSTRPSDATNKKVTWKSSNEKIATVDKNGVVTAVSGGKVNITATSKDNNTITATAEITVKTGYKILINPSHQIFNTTETSNIDTYGTEKKSMYVLADKLKISLENAGYDVYLAPRKGSIDSGDECWERSDSGVPAPNWDECGTKQVKEAIKNENKNGKNLYIALHSNATGKEEVKKTGPYVYYASGQNGSKQFATRLCNSLTNVYNNKGLPLAAGEEHKKLCVVTGGVGEPGKYYNNGGSGQAVLIEIGYHDNQINQTFIENKSKELSYGIIRAINNYIKNDVK